MAISESDEIWPGGVPGRRPRPTPKVHRLDFGLITYDFDYEKDMSGGYKVTEKGWLGGIHLSYSYQKKNGDYYRLFGEYSWGGVTYDGRTMAGAPLTFSDNPQTLCRLEFNMGYTIDIRPGRLLRPYIGLGYRYWERGQANITPTYISYRMKYTWLYIPLGIRADFQIDDHFSIEPHLAARFMFGGKMTAYWSETDPTFNDPNFSLGNEAGLLFEIPVRRKLVQTWSLLITPWYESKKIGQSDPAYLTQNGVPPVLVYEPASTTRQIGIKLGLVYSF